MNRTPALLTLLAIMSCSEYAAPLGAGGSENAELEEIPDRFVTVAMDEEEADAEPAARASTGSRPPPSSAPSTPPVILLEEGEAKPKPAPGSSDAPQVRQWFPESFLWQPLVETGESGTATLAVTVPDQLTTWRVLALAHTRSGHQGGSVHSFDSSLPLYIDPVIPAQLRSGDDIWLPVSAVNTTDRPVNAAISVAAEGAMSGSGVADVRLGANATVVQRIRLRATGAGPATVTAGLTSSLENDVAKRIIPVVPVGNPEHRQRAGSLTTTAAVKISGPSGADPTTQELNVLLFPGSLAVVHSEMDRLLLGASTWTGAYGWALANHSDTLAAAINQTADTDDTRRLRLLSWQRMNLMARAPTAGVAVDLLGALGTPEPDSPEAELHARLVRTVVNEQRADGTWSPQPSSTLQEVLLLTAMAARVLPEDEFGARLRAGGAIERFSRDVRDPFTAAVVVASGAASEDVKSRLRELLTDAIVPGPDETPMVVVPKGIKNAWGYAPGQTEVIAWSILALSSSEPSANSDVRNELLGILMGQWDVDRGFGAGSADVVALESLVRALPGLTSPVDVVLMVGDTEVGKGTLDPSEPLVPALLNVKAPAGPVKLHTSRPVPGLAWHATLYSWVPWTGDERLPGVDVEVTTKSLRAGSGGAVHVSASAPSQARVTLEIGLVAGTKVDESVLTSHHLIESYEVHTDLVRLTTVPFSPGGVLDVKIQVIPSFAGSFTPAATRVSTASQAAVSLAPPKWIVQ